MKQLACIGVILSLLLIGCSGNNGMIDISIYKSLNIARHELITVVLSMTCRVELHVDGRYGGGGTGTCIAIKKEDGIRVAYILTAKHVVDARAYSNPAHNHTTETFTRFWEYGENDIVLQSCIAGPCDVVWRASNSDIAILKVKNPPGFLQVAELMSPWEYSELRMGDAVVRAGCPARLPPFCVFGYISKLDVLFGHPINANLLLLIMGTAHGDSGGGIFDIKTLKLTAVSIVTRSNATHLNGCVPITDMLEELENSDLSFILED